MSDGYALSSVGSSWLRQLCLVSCSWIVACAVPSEFQTASQELVLPTSNEVLNPSFETNAAGWLGWNSVISRVAHANAPHGNYVALVASNAMNGFFTIDDTPSVDTAARADGGYFAAACVAAASPSSEGKIVRVALRAFNDAGAELITSLPASSQVVLTPEFQLTTTQLIAPALTGAIDVYVVQSAGVVGNQFYADGIVVSRSPLVGLNCSREDAGQPDAGEPDAGELDAGELDAGEPDAGQPDAGQPDAGQPDAGEPDAGEPDAGQPDAGEPDAGELDAGELDAGELDAGQPDAGQSDAGQPDAGQSDVGEPDAGTSSLAPDVHLALGCDCNSNGELLLVLLFLLRRQPRRRDENDISPSARIPER